MNDNKFWWTWNIFHAKYTTLNMHLKFSYYISNLSMLLFFIRLLPDMIEFYCSFGLEYEICAILYKCGHVQQMNEWIKREMIYITTWTHEQRYVVYLSLLNFFFHFVYVPHLLYLFTVYAFSFRKKRWFYLQIVMNYWLRL